MAYKIQYSPDAARNYPQKVKRQQIRYGGWIMLLVFFAAAIWMRLYGVPDFLIPGDPVVTRQAASMMMDEIQSGAAFTDAVTVFCKEILHGAGF